jgi:hypothetical protein
MSLEMSTVSVWSTKWSKTNFINQPGEKILRKGAKILLAPLPTEKKNDEI